jgi:hypothetical protein
MELRYVEFDHELIELVSKTSYFTRFINIVVWHATASSLYIFPD